MVKMPLYNDNNFDNHMLHYGYIKNKAIYQNYLK